MVAIAAHKLPPTVASELIAAQDAYTEAQREFAIGSPHMIWVIAKRRPLPPSVRKEVFDRDGGVCSYCPAVLTMDDFTVDHVFPVARGGSDDLNNLVLSCRSCNSQKGARVI